MARSALEYRDVLICGLPSSGNHMIREMVQALTKPLCKGQIRWRTGIWHGWGPDPTNEPPHVWVIIPVRCPRCKELSRARREICAYDEKECTRRVVMWVTQKKLRVLIFSYESAIHDQETVGKQIAEFLGVPYTGWPKPVTDENAKYTEGAS